MVESPIIIGAEVANSPIIAASRSFGETYIQSSRVCVLRTLDEFKRIGHQFRSELY
jgi:hypothetical protein